ncbi:haloacid dehalogenase type II [Paracoccus sp. (in: a-proteobacteria)]|uniref:haloacid dehalogenase type II n=1 Tax=Paracoccus sp. TaxID=267 RepID=UPI00396C9A00
MPAKPVLVFDVNETLLDLDHLRPLFGTLFDDEEVMREWFAQLILYSQVLTLTKVQSDFRTLAGAVLRMIGTIKGVNITDAQVDQLLKAIGRMPPHADAAEALAHLHDQGFHMVTLTNSPPSDGPSALERSGLDKFFRQSFSVQPTGCFKPAPQTYRLVSDALGRPVSDLCLVACHAWDTIGLQSLGGKGALVTHGINASLQGTAAPCPDLVAPTLMEMAHKISVRWAADTP